VFVDVDRRPMNIDPHAVEAAITPRTHAIVPVHLAGRPCDMARLLGLISSCANATGQDVDDVIDAVLDVVRCFRRSSAAPGRPTTAEASGATVRRR
jgi:hypothetical protein